MSQGGVNREQGTLTLGAPRLSVILPFRNASATLCLAVRSVLKQSFGDFELLLLDDGSVDGGAALVARLHDPRIVLIRNAGAAGLASRLNQGIDLARGEYVARMDADDVCFEERFARQVAFLDAHSSIDLVGCRALVFRSDGVIVGLLPFAGSHAALCARPWRNIPLPHPGWMGRRAWFARHRYRLPEVLRAEDQELLLRAAPVSQYACLADVLLGYRQGPYALGKTLRARRSLLGAQIGLFTARGQWREAWLALGLTLCKTAIDLAAALPGGEALYFRRMSEPASAAAVAALRECLRDEVPFD